MAENALQIYREEAHGHEFPEFPVFCHRLQKHSIKALRRCWHACMLNLLAEAPVLVVLDSNDLTNGAAAMVPSQHIRKR